MSKANRLHVHIRELAKASKVKEGYLDYAGKRVLNVMISPHLIERCSILLDAPIKLHRIESRKPLRGTRLTAAIVLPLTSSLYRPGTEVLLKVLTTFLTQQSDE
jgi:hypothetical protein